MKKWVWWAWLIGPLVPVLIFVVVAFALQPGREEQTVEQFEADRATLEQLALQVLEQGSTWEIETPDHWRGMNLYRGECPSVEFEFQGSGFASETTYWGVTYVPCDHTMYMKCFRDMGWETQDKTETGTVFFEPEGDNTCYVKKLDDCWYYYEMSF